MRLLVSVVDAEEAELAVAGGVAIVDVKNPSEGSLGAPAPGVIAQVRDVVPAELPLSAALGDLPCLPGTAALAALGAARSGAAYVKLGLWGLSGTEDAVIEPDGAEPDGPGWRSTARLRSSPAPTPTPRGCRGGRGRRLSWLGRRGRRDWVAS